MCMAHVYGCACVGQRLISHVFLISCSLCTLDTDAEPLTGTQIWLVYLANSPWWSSVSTWEELGSQVRICVGAGDQSQVPMLAQQARHSVSHHPNSGSSFLFILIYITLGYTMIIHSSAVSTHFGSFKHRNLGTVIPILHGANWAATHARVFNVIWDSCH